MPQACGTCFSGWCAKAPAAKRLTQCIDIALIRVIISASTLNLAQAGSFVRPGAPMETMFWTVLAIGVGWFLLTRVGKDRAHPHSNGSPSAYDLPVVEEAEDSQDLGNLGGVDKLAHPQAD